MEPIPHPVPSLRFRGPCVPPTFEFQNKVSFHYATVVEIYHIYHVSMVITTIHVTTLIICSRYRKKNSRRIHGTH